MLVIIDDATDQAGSRQSNGDIRQEKSHAASAWDRTDVIASFVIHRAERRWTLRITNGFFERMMSSDDIELCRKQWMRRPVLPMISDERIVSRLSRFAKTAVTA